jgi:hypothetical protein
MKPTKKKRRRSMVRPVQMTAAEMENVTKENVLATRDSLALIAQRDPIHGDLMEDVGQNSPSMANLVNVILFDMQMENSAHVAPQSDGVVAHLNIANAKVVRISENQKKLPNAPLSLSDIP